MSRGSKIRRSASHSSSSDRIRDLEHELDHLKLEYERLAKDFAELEEIKNEVMVEEIKNEVMEIHDMANRWKGGFIVIVALGGVAGWILSNIESVLKLVGKGS